MPAPEMSPRGRADSSAVEREALRAKQEARKKRAAAIAAQRAEAEQRLKSLENQLEQLKSDMAPPSADSSVAFDSASMKSGVYSTEVEDLLADM